VIRTIIGVCQQFSIVRFDAAMTLAKRHIQRLWYPVPGQGGDIASRAEHAISNDEFNARIPNEFWREVVDRCAAEAPHTLLLAEAFWMMEGYFVRTLGMHRVYNSAFMNMLKNEDNAKYRATIKNTMEFDPEILKRFVNFMNNPDEDTAVAQFGKGDKYFGICTLLVTMPGLPMFGHGQVEGFEEKYGMEYRRSYKDEEPDGYLVDRHDREIFPLVKRRALFSGSSDFQLYDLFTEGGGVNENVFAYSNRAWIGGGEERALIFFNNSFQETAGWIRMSDPAVPVPGGGRRRDSLSEALALHGDEAHFTLFRDQRSGLWYIRSSKAICENGFFVALKGYEAQVFIDIYEIADDEKGRWARLHHDLQGRGVSDPHSAIMDIYLGDLYHRFTKMLRPETVANLHRFFVSGKADKEEAQAFIASIKETAEKYFDSVRYFITGADGKFEPWAPPAGADGLPVELEPMDKEALWQEFAAYVERLIWVAGYVKAGKKTPADRLLGELAREMKERQAICAAALGYGLLAILRPIIGKGADGNHDEGTLAANLAFDHWGLDRKLAEQIGLFGATGIDPRRIAETSKAVLRRIRCGSDCACCDESGDATAKAPFEAGYCAAAFIEANYLQDDFRALIGANVWDDVTWFNKEAFESTVFHGKLLMLLEACPWVGGRRQPWLERAARIGEVAEVLDRAKAASGYKLGGLLRALTGETESAVEDGKESD